MATDTWWNVPMGDDADCPAQANFPGWRAMSPWCTRDAGHDGPHVAHDADHHVVAVWVDEDPETDLLRPDDGC